MTQSVRLISISQSKIDGVNSPEELIAHAARVSNPANQFNHETSGKLLAYLIRNHHFSPFEMVSMTVEIKTTRDIGRQILRHRSFSFQEFSGRYAKMTEFMTKEARYQDLKNRQNSIEGVSEELADIWAKLQENISNHAQEAYEEALELGIAKEVARSVLPEGLVGSTLYMSGTIRSFYHYCQLRMAPGVQKEHREIANMIADIFREQFPSIPLVALDHA